MTPVAITRFDVAAPFLASALLLLLGPFAVLAIVHRLAGLYAAWPREQVHDHTLKDSAAIAPGGRGREYQAGPHDVSTVASHSVTHSVQPPLIGDPDQAAQNVIWAVDASQILSVFLGPIVGLFLLRSHIGTAVAVLYVATIVVSVAGFLGFTFRVRPDHYHTAGRWIFTPVTLLGLFATLAAAGTAAAIGP